MPINLNEAAEYREFGAMMPDGTFCWVNGKIRPGQVSLPGMPPEDQGIFKQAKDSDVVYLDWEFTVMSGPYAGAKLWQNTSLAGGQVDDKNQSKAGNITKSFFRAMVESAFGINPKDTTPQAAAYRNIPSYRALESLTFAVRIGVQEGEARPNGGTFPDRNTIAKIVLPGEPQYEPMKAGQEIPPQPSGPRHARATPAGGGPAAATGQSALWQTEAANAVAAPAPAPVAAVPAAAPAQATPAQAWAQPAAPVAPAAPAAAWPAAAPVAPAPAAPAQPAAAWPAAAPAGGPQPAAVAGGPTGPGPAWMNG